MTIIDLRSRTTLLLTFSHVVLFDFTLILHSLYRYHFVSPDLQPMYQCTFQKTMYTCRMQLSDSDAGSS